MTEAEWLTCDDPQLLLAGLSSHSERKLRLAAVACCMHEPRRHPKHLRACKVAEAFADGQISPSRLRKVELAARIAYESPFANEIAACLVARRSFSAELTQEIFGCMLNGCLPSDLEANASLVRDIFGNPFRPVAVDPSWLTSTVHTLANGIYAERAFDRLPILADALQDAGCENPDILAHCRGPGPHVRGCWLVDMLTNRD